MPICPFAEIKEMPGYSGSYTSGPFKIVHHTTQGSTAESAFGAYEENRSAPHFTVDETTIYQHFDTAKYSRSLANPDGGVQTNRESAIQIEVVGYAEAPKDGRTLTLVARLCRWIEENHDVDRVWPSGLPKMADENGNDPGGHNRDVENWTTVSGHYGHSQVPENTHWDPAYSPAEVALLMSSDEERDLISPGAAAPMQETYTQRLMRDALNQRPDWSNVVNTMPDHGHGASEDLNS